ncbi:MAG TPA: hypothetical protein VFE40_04170 [Jatrophihabitantaceae bacterium]|jgi:nitroreductase|nr:hypothetical protein [Jatrophihabitantaceae bacterium]
MTTVTDTRLSRALRRAAVAATRAPSVHNTQPWHFTLTGDALVVRADPNRRLQVLDPRGRQLTLSCGCAVFNARTALAAAGYASTVLRFPDPLDSTVLARIVVDRAGEPDPALAALAPFVELRQTNRRAFSEEAVPPEFVGLLVEAASREGGLLEPVERPKDRHAVARLSQLAERQESSDPAYRAELRAWTSADPSRADGVHASTVPHVDAGAEDDLPIRDFDTHGAGALPTRTHSSAAACLLLLGAREDDPESWLRAGEALERVWLEITRHGYAASPFTQVIEVQQTNALLRSELQLTMHPHLLLRVGRAPRTPETRRRRLVDVLTETPPDTETPPRSPISWS